MTRIADAALVASLGVSRTETNLAEPQLDASVEPGERPN
jgi:hypothetical protein